MRATSSSCYFDMDVIEGNQLRKSVLIRNAVMASTREKVVGMHHDQDAQHQVKHRWTIMAAQSGIHPSDYLDNVIRSASDDDGDEEDDSDDDDEVILLPRIQLKDHYDVAVQVDDNDDLQYTIGIEADPHQAQDQDQDESEWFDGLLDEVRDSVSPCNLDVDEDEEKQMSNSSIPSLPSLIIDEYDDTSEEDEAAVPSPEHQESEPLLDNHLYLHMTNKPFNT